MPGLGAGFPQSVLRRKHRFIVVVLVLAISVRIAVLLLIGPVTDVYYYDAQAVTALLSGANPYSHTFTGIPPSLQTPGAEKVFAYLPLTAFYLVPFQLLGDVRIGFVLADALVGLVLWLMAGRLSQASASLYLLFPPVILFSTVFLNNALVSILFMTLFAFFESRRRFCLSGLFLGLSLAAIQIPWLLLPPFGYYLLRRRRFRQIGVIIAAVAAAILPLALLDPTSFLNDTVYFQFARPTSALLSTGGPLGFSANPSLNGFLSALNLSVPTYAKVALLVVVLALFFRRMSTLKELLLRSSGFLLSALFILPNDFFWAYAEFPFLLFLAYAALGD